MGEQVGKIQLTGTECKDDQGLCFFCSKIQSLPIEPQKKVYGSHLRSNGQQVSFENHNFIILSTIINLKMAGTQLYYFVNLLDASI